MLQNARVTAFAVSKLLRKNQQEGKIIPLPFSPLTHTQVRVNNSLKKSRAEGLLRFQ